MIYLNEMLISFMQIAIFFYENRYSFGANLNYIGANQN